MAKIQYFKDSYGNTASIKPASGGFELVCRDYTSKVWKRSSHVSFPAARAALRRTGDTWESTKNK